MDTTVSEDMNQEENLDILNTLVEIEQLDRKNHEIVMRSLETVAEIITALNDRITKLEAQING